MDRSVKERDRISVLRQVNEGMLTPAVEAERPGVTRRHFRRTRRGFETEGDAAVVHRLRGRRSNRSLPAELRERAMVIARDPLYRDFGPTLLAEHLERTFGVRVSVETPRHCMLKDGLWERRRRCAKHRRRRKRRAVLGELGRWDSSVHRWLEDRAGEFVLILIHDDAASRLMIARFVERDDGAGNRRAIIGYLRRHGRLLAEWWTPLWNERVTVAPRDPMDVHRPLPPGVDLEPLFAKTETREVQRDFSIRFCNVYWQIPEQEAVHVSPRSSVVVELRLNGETRFRATDRYLEAECLARARPRTQRPVPNPGCGHPVLASIPCAAATRAVP